MPVYSEKTIKEIKSRLDLSDVVKTYFPILEKSGNRKWIKCPFHSGGNERTPSCLINDERAIYHCFSCGESGDMFSFVEKMENITFSEAVEKLASIAGVSLEVGRGARKSKDFSPILYEINEITNNLFSSFYKEKDEAKEAREMIRVRMIGEETVRKFSLGYAPKDNSYLYSFLKNKGYSDDILKKTGLFSLNNFPYPLFVNRLIFPVRDRNGKVIAFSGRSLTSSSNSPKYINSSESEIYLKRKNLYGLFESQTSLKTGKESIILVEGNFDVISMHQAGLTRAVAPLGTAFTDEQAKLILRYNERVDLMFDSDEAGQKSTVKAILILQKNGADCHIHKLKRGKDSSEVLEKYGADGLLEDWSSSLSSFDYLVNNAKKMYNIKEPRGKAATVLYLKDFINSTSSGVERDAYVSSLSSLLSVSDASIRKDLGEKNINKEVSFEVADKKPSRFSLDLFLMLYLANHRHLFKNYRSRIQFSDLVENEAKEIYSALENATRQGYESDELFISLLQSERARNIVCASFALNEYREENNEALEEAVMKITLRSYERNRDFLVKEISNYSEGEDIRQMIERKTELDRKISIIKSELRGMGDKDEE